MASSLFRIFVLATLSFTSTNSVVDRDIASNPTLDHVIKFRGKDIKDIGCHDKKWHLFILSVVVTFVTAVGLTLLFRMATFWFGNPYTSEAGQSANEQLLTHSIEERADPPSQTSRHIHNYNQKGRHNLSWRREAKDFATEIISGQTVTGRIFVVMVFLFSMISCVSYIVDTTKGAPEICLQFKEHIWHQIDVSANVFFAIYFVLRYVAALDKLRFLVELYSIVDFFTIPPAFLSVYLDRTWLGFRYMRAIRVLSIPDILHYFYILRTATAVRLAQLITVVVSVWLTSAGIIHLLENSGDPIDFANVHPVTYWECLYFLVVTMATVGYGDIYCETILGKVFIVLFILIALAVFASCIPEIIELVGSVPKFSGQFIPLQGKRHVVVCGHTSFQNVNNFVIDIVHNSGEKVEMQVVFLDSNPPEWNLEAFIKLHYLSLEYFQGSALDSQDLGRVKIDEAMACLVVSNKAADDPDADDAASIMRVMSIKKYSGDIRVVVQLMSSHNKFFLMNIPTWSQKRRDDVICFSELKLGLIAQSCFAPGFSTMMSNLFSMRSYKLKMKESVWKADYLYGASMEIVTEYLSPSFAGLTFAETAEICFVKLCVLLVAVSVDSTDEGRTVEINPKGYFRIRDGTLAFFIAEHPEDVKRALWYCSACHSDVKVKTLIRRCKCKTKKSKMIVTMPEESSYTHSSEIHTVSTISIVDEHEKENKKERQSVSRKMHKVGIPREIEWEKIEIKLDSTGLFHWQPARPMEEHILDRGEASMSILNGHIILCIFASPDSSLIQIRNFVMPLRTSNLPYNELKHIVIVGDTRYLQKEWKTLQNFPKISIFNGSPLSRADLQALNISLCDMCVILSAKTSSSSDVNLADKEVILANMNIKAMTFEENSGILSTDGQGDTKYVSVAQRGSVYGSNIPLLSELRYDTNARFLSQNDDDGEDDSEFYLTKSFACGNVFAVSVLDSLMSTTLFNSDALALIRTLVLGGATAELDKLLGEGGVLKGPMREKPLNRDRCRLGQISLYEGPFAKYGDGSKYGDLFVATLRLNGMLCLGIYRLLNSTHLGERSNMRYVITNPSYDFLLLSTDLVFVLRQFGSTGPEKP